MFSTILPNMQIIFGKKMLVAMIVLVLAAGACELMVIRTGTSAYWGNLTAILSISTLAIGSVGWCLQDAKRDKHNLTNRRGFIQKLCSGIFIILVIGIVLENKFVALSDSILYNSTLGTFDQWFVMISSVVLLCTVVVPIAYGLINRRIRPSN